MKEVADGVWHLNTFPFPNGVNAYLAGDVLIDAGTKRSTKGILRDLEGHTVTAHALTHAHPDHQGASHDVCTTFGIPYWVPDGDVEPAEDPELIGQRQPDNFVAQFFARTMHGPAHKVDRVLRDGDEVAGFRVISAPGHSAGHVVYFRESDRVLIIGDVLANMDILTGIPGLQPPKGFLTPDPDTNRRSAKTLATLEPSLVLFGHGKPHRDPKKFVDFLNRLPD